MWQGREGWKSKTRVASSDIQVTSSNLRVTSSNPRVTSSNSRVTSSNSRVTSSKKRKDSLEGSLDRVLFAAELEFLKILVPRLPQHTSNVNTECAGKSKHLYSLCDQLLGALIYLNFIILILICF